MKKIVIIIAAAMLLGGCGADWFPDQTAGTKDSQTAIDSVDAGTLVASLRNGPAACTIITTKGVFSTYTSLGAPAQTPVRLETHTDPVTGLIIGKLLRALQKTILVKEVLALVP